MKYLYIYSDNSVIKETTFDDQNEEFFINETYEFHSIDNLKKKTILKESNGKKFLHIFKKHSKMWGDTYKYYASYCIS